jgi:small-conductance mechanosensitive channel
MNGLFDPDSLLAQLDASEAWLFDQVLTAASLAQLIFIAASLALASWLGRRLGAWAIEQSRVRSSEPWVARVAVTVSDLATPLVWLLLTWVAAVASALVGWHRHFLTIAATLLAAWVAIGIVSALIRDRAWSKTVAIVAWSIAALNIVGLLDPVVGVLDAASLTIGTFRISLLLIIKGVLALAVLLWVATALANLLERRIFRAQNLTPSVRVLFTKLVRIVLLVIAVVVAVQTVGIDLSAFTVFTGALGLGLGFGLQKLVSNLFSGVMILMDKSVKPGDVISVGETYGWVNSLGSRYVSIATRDGIEYLIPNEDFITQRVANWSYSSDDVRLKIAISIAYEADVRRAMRFAEEAAVSVERVLKKPKPFCVLKAFGESAIELELRIWIRDPRNGVTNVKSEVMVLVWERYVAEGIEFASPRRELRLQPGEPLRVAVEPGTLAQHQVAAK